MDGILRIGAAYFTKVKHEYANWRFAFAREVWQNSVDCGSSVIGIDVKYEDAKTIVTVTNNGAPMKRETITDKLLCLGESGKNFQGTIGGFGVGSSLIYFCHDNYEIHTGNHKVTGRHGDYTITDNPYFEGTKSIITMEGDESQAITNAFELLLALSQWSGKAILNGKHVTTNLHKGTPRREFDWGTLYSNKQGPLNRLIVRINGIPMFSKWVDIDRCLIFESNKPSPEILLTSRDGLKSELDNQVMRLIQEIAIDKQSALQNRHPKYTHFYGPKLQITIPKKATEQVEELTTKIAAYSAAPELPTRETALSREEVAEQQHISLYNLIVKNNLGMTIPDYYKPGASMSSYAAKLLEKWVKCLVGVHTILKFDKEFSIGWLFDEERIAECEESKEYGLVYYLNPAKIVKNQRSNSRSLTKRFALTPASTYELISIAVHEYVHAEGITTHSEWFANRYTTCMGIVMANLPKLRSLLK